MGALVRVNGGIVKRVNRGIGQGQWGYWGQWRRWSGSMGALVRVNGGIEKGQWVLVGVNGGIEQWGLNGGLVRVNGGIEKDQWGRWSGSMHGEGSGSDRGVAVGQTGGCLTGL